MSTQGTALVADKAHDIWALGVMLFVLATETFPWLAARFSDRDYIRFLDHDTARDPRWSKLSLPFQTVCHDETDMRAWLTVDAVAAAARDACADWGAVHDCGRAQHDGRLRAGCQPCLRPSPSSSGC